MSAPKLTTIISDIDRKMLELVKSPDRYQQYREIFHQASSFIKRPAVPVHVDIELTNTCNYTCSFCEHGRKPKKAYYKAPRTLPYTKVVEILEECSRIGVRSIQYNVANEPLLYKQLAQAVRKASELGFDDIFFMTNGSLLGPDVSRELIEAGLTKLMVSIDAFSEETYRLVRQRSNYGSIVKNILKFLELREQGGGGLPVVRVSFVMNSFNEHEADEFRRFWEKKVDFIAFQNLIHLDQDGRARNISKKLKEYRCNMSNFRATIKADGTVKPCCVFHGDKLNFGNIYKTSLKEIWTSSRWKRFQDMHEDFRWNEHPVCKECVMSTDFN